MIVPAYAFGDLPSPSFLGSELRTRIDRLKLSEEARRKRSKPLEYYGGVSGDFGSVPTTANQAANDQALIWASEDMAVNGGVLELGGFQYGFSDPFEMPSYFKMIGTGLWHSTCFWPNRQPCLFTTNAAGASRAFITLRDFRITNNQWNHGQSAADADAFAAIDFQGSNLGPDDPNALARESRQKLFDPYHEVSSVGVWKFDGTALRAHGRGEIFLHRMIVIDVSGHGFDTSAPDNWVAFNTISGCGLDGWKAQASNYRVVGNKIWFVGKLGSEEVIGAGVRHVGFGQGNFISVADAFQDCMGPAIYVQGEHISYINMNATELGGGRVEGQGDGWQGARTNPRAIIWTNGAKNCQVHGTIDNNDHNGAGNRPQLVYFGGSGDRNSVFDFRNNGGNFNATRVGGVNGFFNAKRYCKVVLNGETVFGKQAAADLGDVNAGINEAGYRPTVVEMDDGRFAHWTGSAWVPTQSGSPIVPN